MLCAKINFYCVTIKLFDTFLTKFGGGVEKVCFTRETYQEVVMKKRSIPLTIIFTIISCGIYGLYLIYKLADELICELDYEKIDNAGLNVLWAILSCGIYLGWWHYKISKYLSTIERKNGIEPDFWAPVFSLVFGTILHISRMNQIIETKENR